MFNEYISINQAIFIALLSMSIVFLILLILAFLTMSFKNIFKPKNTNQVENSFKVSTIEKEQIPKNIVNLDEIVNDELKLVAILVASIEANESDQDKKYKVTSIVEV